MLRVIFYYHTPSQKSAPFWPKGEGVEIRFADRWEDFTTLLVNSEEQVDLVVMGPVPRPEKTTLIRRIRKIRNIPVMFLEERELPPQESESGTAAQAGKRETWNWREIPPERAVPEDDPLEEARRYIQENFTRPLTLTEIASRAGLSGSYFCRTFCARYGQPPINYLRELRFARAAELLARTNTPLSTIAQQSGFSSLAYFCREFKKATGHTPLSYRHRFQGRKRRKNNT